MAVPWTGFPLAALVDLARPLGSAKYRADGNLHGPDGGAGAEEVLVSLALCRRPDDGRGDGTSSPFWSPACTASRCRSRTARRCASRCRGNTASNRSKSIVHFEFTDKRPSTYWEALQSSEYGFWANVNPAVPHPRWSQATERVLGTDERVPTLILERLRRIRRRHVQGPRKRAPFRLRRPSPRPSPRARGEGPVGSNPVANPAVRH